jgi:glycosyltransferase involved in cell wall biosynthesis
MAKIALINQRYGLEINGGSEYYTRLIAEQLAKKHEVEVLTTCALSHEDWKNYYSSGLHNVNGITVRRFPTTQNRLSGHPKDGEKWIDNQGPFVPELIDYIKKHKDEYDVFFPVTYLYYPTVRTIPLIAEKSIIIPTAHDEHLIYYPVYRRVFGADENFVKPAAFLFLTEEERKFVHKLFKNHSIPCWIAGVGVGLPNDIDADRFRKKYGITEDYCIYVGRIEQGKNCEAMLRYFLEYKKRNKNNIKLVLIGKSSFKIEIPKNDDIIHLGFVSEEDKFDAISGAKVLWLNSMFESLSIVVLEALSLGVPVLVNEHCEVLKGHCVKSNAGLYYKGYLEFESVLNYLLRHERECAIMRNNAKEYIMKYYTWDIVMGKFDKAIELVMQKR